MKFIQLVGVCEVDVIVNVLGLEVVLVLPHVHAVV